MNRRRIAEDQAEEECWRLKPGLEVRIVAEDNMVALVEFAEGGNRVRAFVPALFVARTGSSEEERIFQVRAKR